jgi:GDP-D-mannose dehydratase
VPNLRAKSEKAQKMLNWKTKVTFDGLVKMMVAADIARQEKLLKANL